jgi:DNA polymerase-3 subunit delta
MRVLRAAIHDKQFSPAYYLYGDDDFLKEDALRHLIDAAVDPATRDFNLDQRKGSELTAEALGSLLAMPPMMAERRVVVIRDVSALKKDARAVLEKQLAAATPDLLILLSAPAEAKEDKTLSTLAVPAECEPLTGAQLPKWIVARVERLGAKISPQAIELLQDAVGGDLGQLAIEIDKLVAFAGGREIDESAVAAVVGVRRDETLGRLLDAVGERDAALAVSLIPGVLQQPKTSGVQAVMALTTQMLALAVGHTRSIPRAARSREYFALLRSAGSNFTGRAWGEAVAAWARIHDRWSQQDLDHALAALLQCDFALKTSRVSSDEQVLASAVLDICRGPRGRSAA